MPYSNVIVSVTDPDSLIAGTSPFAPFVVASIQVYRYTSEENARANSGGVLVTTFTLVASTTTPVSDTAGPWRYATYDSGQLAGSWYRYVFADAGLLTFSQYSIPWKPKKEGSGISLATLVYEVGQLIQDEVSRGTVKAGAAASTSVVDCPTVFQSTLRDARWWQGAYVLCEANANAPGDPPEGSEQLIASVDTTLGQATLDAPFPANIETGDTFQVHPLAPPSRIIRSINLVRERMFVVLNHDVALQQSSTAGNRYPAPPGVKNNADIYEAKAIWRSANRPDYEEEWNWPLTVEFDGTQGWIKLDVVPSPILRIRHELSYRDLEGNLSAMTDTTQASLEWLRKAAAWETYRWLDRADGSNDRFLKLTGITEGELRMLSGRYAPDSPSRPLQTGHREFIGPVPV